MKEKLIGRTNVAVTTLGFGGAPIGNLYRATTDEEAESAITAAWDGGVRYFDTAPHYGLGLSERRLGRVLSAKARDQFVLSTKVGRLLTPNPHPVGSDLESGAFDVPDDLTRTLDYSADGVKRSIEESLRRLDTDYVDIVYVHDPDDHVQQVIRETFPALVKLREQGVVRAIGAGMNFWQPLLTFVQSCDIDVVMLAGRWTLLDRSGAPLLQACEERNVAVVAAAPFNSGILSRAKPQSDGHFDYQGISAELFARANQLAAACDSFGVELPAAAINFPLREESVVSVVAGFRSASQMLDGVRWMNEEIPEALWLELESQ
jgi:D-threo-aldose 1-dehydrogenase